MPAPAMMTLVFDMTVLCEGGGVGGICYYPADTSKFYTDLASFEAEADRCALPYSAIRSGVLGTQSGSLEVFFELIRGLWAHLGRVSWGIYPLHAQLRLTRKRCSSIRRSLAKSDAIALVI